MSTHINLLPWREEQKKQRQTEFFVVLGIAAAVGAAVWFGGRWHLNSEIQYQQQRNNMLQQEIRTLDRQIARIRDLEATRDQLEARMRVIQELQTGRPQIVHLFEQMVLTLPDGVFLNTLQQQGGIITLTGVGQSNARVSNYMERLDSSSWLRDPNLDVIEVRDRDGIRVSNFTLRVQQTNPTAADNGEEAQ
ncbi:MAG: PilN domain-containing protein [Ectothiorhodospiraceae bacterium]|nr:PilN domain-containing protein [Ectothiorhodospiraceae bacterium]